jgi:hypothetical protein
MWVPDRVGGVGRTTSPSRLLFPSPWRRSAGGPEPRSIKHPCAWNFPNLKSANGNQGVSSFQRVRICTMPGGGLLEAALGDKEHLAWTLGSELQVPRAPRRHFAVWCVLGGCVCENLGLQGFWSVTKLNFEPVSFVLARGNTLEGQTGQFSSGGEGNPGLRKGNSGVSFAWRNFTKTVRRGQRTCWSPPFCHPAAPNFITEATLNRRVLMARNVFSTATSSTPTPFIVAAKFGANDAVDSLIQLAGWGGRGAGRMALTLQARAHYLTSLLTILFSSLF